MNKGGAALLLLVAILLIWLANSGKLQKVWGDLFPATPAPKTGAAASGTSGASTTEPTGVGP